MRRFTLPLLLCAILVGGLGTHPVRAAGSHSAPRVNFEPTVPFIFDGVRYAPADIQRFEHQPLHFVLDHKAYAEGVLLAFRTSEEAAQYTAHRAGATSTLAHRGEASGSLATTDCSSWWHDAYAYNWPYFQRGSLNIAGDLPDLTRVQRGFWPWDNWNDVISSIWVGCETSITLYVNSNYGGGSFAIPQNTNLDGLPAWLDNQTSSIRYREWETICEIRQGHDGQSETWCYLYDDYGTYLGFRRVA